MEPSQHQYQPLDNHTIRVLTLDPGQPDDRLVGTLESVRIDAMGEYEALSYVWAEPGPSRSTYVIVIRDKDGKDRTLALRGGSIFAALCRLRLPAQPRRIWADQCCINQDDLVERGHQVQYMNRIYRDAARVLVWLGLDTKREAASAFGLMHELDEFLGSSPTDELSRIVERERLERHVRENYGAIEALTDRAWFKRGWIAQEIGTSTPATMIWGDAAIEWNILAGVCERLKKYHHLRSTLGIATSDISFLFRRFVEPDERTHHANRFNLVYELQRSRHLQFSNDRDRIFAFLGHFSVRSTHPLSCGPMSINADYTKTVEQTYIDVAMQILSTHPSAACIILASAQHAPHSLPSCSGTDAQRESGLDKWLQDKHKLPSWVPDWRTSEGIILAEPICPHRAHGDSTTKLEIMTEGGPVLRIHGMRIDTIEFLSQPLHANDFYGVNSADHTITMIEKLWHDICGKEMFDLDTNYIDGGSSFFAFMQTLSNGCVQAAGHDCKSYNEIPDSVWLQKAARYVVETIGSSENVAASIRRIAELIEGEWDHDKWSRWATSAADGRILARTGKGYYVLGPAALEEGDVVCILYGCKMPFCLRPIGSRYILVGECYVHGLMKGEALDMLGRGDFHDQMFDIV